MIKKMFFSLLTTVLLVGCGDDIPQEKNVEFSTIAYGNQSNFYNSNHNGSKQVFKDTENWNSFIEVAGDEYFPEKEIDFNQFEVVAVLRDLKGHGADVRIKEIKETPSSLMVMYTTTDYITTVITRPYHLVKIPKKNKVNVKFIEVSN